MIGQYTRLEVGSSKSHFRPIGFIEDESGCWIWQNHRNACGYGTTRNPTTGRKMLAHRLMYEWFVGPVPPGLVLDHFKCDNRACCNPFHVRPVTQRENSLRGNTLAARQLARDTCKRGHPLVPENLRKSASEPHKRRCRICKNDAARRQGREVGAVI